MRRKIIFASLAILVTPPLLCYLVALVFLARPVFPKPVQETKPTLVDAGSGSGGNWGHYAYLSTLPLEQVEGYYTEQMGRYCKTKAQFSDLERQFDSSSLYLVPSSALQRCRTARCSIPARFGLGATGDFLVELCSAANGQTHVYYVNHAEN